MDALTRIRLLLGDFVRFAAAHPELHRFMLQEGTGRSDRLEWLVEKHVGPMVAFIRSLFAELQASGNELPGPPEQIYYAMIGAASTAYALAPEFELTMGKDPFSKEMVDAHVELLMRLFLPSFSQHEGAFR